MPKLGEPLGLGSDREGEVLTRINERMVDVDGYLYLRSDLVGELIASESFTAPRASNSQREERSY